MNCEIKLPNFNIINGLHDVYLETVTLVATRYFEEIFKPWLEKHGLEFHCGMGTWTIESMQSGKMIDIDRVPKWKDIEEALSTQIQGTDNCFGEFMPEYYGYQRIRKNTKEPHRECS